MLVYQRVTSPSCGQMLRLCQTMMTMSDFRSELFSWKSVRTVDIDFPKDMRYVQTCPNSWGDQWLDLSRGSVEKPSKSHGLRPKIFPSIWWPLWVSPVEDTPMSWWRWHDLGFPSHGFHKMDICKIWWETMINTSNSTFDKRLYMMIFPHLCFPIKYPQSKPKPWPSIGSFQFGPNKNGVHIGGRDGKGSSEKLWDQLKVSQNCASSSP
jgi:hypothetical protein